VAVGERLTVPSDATVVDATGKIVLPGFVESHSHVGLRSDGVAGEGHDFNETSDPATPHMRAIDGINPGDGAFRDVLAARITTLLAGAGSANLFGGEWAAIKQHMGIWRDLRVKRRTTEVDVLVGVIVASGRELGIATLVNAALLDLVHAIETGRCGMEW